MDRYSMGENGYRRVTACYRMEQMLDTYRRIYSDFEEKVQKDKS